MERSLVMNIKYQLVLESLKDRNHLPFRKVTQIFILDDKKNIICKLFDTYVKFPGGGVDEHEQPIVAIKREVMEEVGAHIDNIKQVGRVQYIWPPEWAVSNTQKERYEIFKGADNIIFRAHLVKLSKPTSQEKDRWYGKLLYPLSDIIKTIEKNKKYELKGFEKFRELQLKILKEIALKKVMYI